MIIALQINDSHFGGKKGNSLKNGVAKHIKIIVASGNAGKIKEIKKLFCEECFSVVSMHEAGIALEVEENAKDFIGNALLKARALYGVLGDRGDTLILSDDSGLCVEALGGEPGIYSARYANHCKGIDSNSSDLENNLLLIERLKQKNLSSSRAYFIAGVVLLGELGGVEVKLVSEQKCEGRVYADMLGEGGFGYDSLFEPCGYTQRMAQLSLEEKNRISHRFKAICDLKNQLQAHLK